MHQVKIRRLKLQEEKILQILIDRAELTSAFVGWQDKLQAYEMNDGGMGSLVLLPEGKEMNDRNFGQMVSELIFRDSDGVPVIVSLNLDSNNQLFELDFWKVDFSPVIQIPELFD